MITQEQRPVCQTTLEPLLSFPALEGHKPKPNESHQARVPAAASIEVLQGPLRYPIRYACTDSALQVITPDRIGVQLV